MQITSKDIISAIEAEFPQTDNTVTIKNSSDLDIEGEKRYGFQYLVGVCHRDPLQATCEYYKSYMRERLTGFHLHGECRAWSWEDYDLENIKTVLKEISDRFDANLDVERMILKLNMKRPSGDIYFLAITVVFIPLISVAQAED